MNLFEKIQNIKSELQQANLKKTGENRFAKYKYYELADFLPTIIELCKGYKLFTSISFNNEVATLKVINCEAIEETTEITSPMRKLDLKGCNEIQALGGVETYQRRYLYQTMFDIVENDMFDCSTAEQPPKREYKCAICNKPFQSFMDKNGKTWSAAQVYYMAIQANSDDKPRCRDCKIKLERGQEYAV